jgi:hypothetical protein
MATEHVDATVSGASSNSYLTLEEADELFEGFKPAVMDAWDALEDDARANLLKWGTRVIDRYRDWGPPAVANQRLKFPRTVDQAGVIPSEVQSALVEFCAFQLEGEGESADLKRLAAEGVTSVSILGQSMSLGGGPGGVADASELPAGARRELDGIATTSNACGVVTRAIDGSSDTGSFYG